MAAATGWLGETEAERTGGAGRLAMEIGAGSGEAALVAGARSRRLVADRRRALLDAAAKRALDIVVALLALVVLLPLLAAVALLVKLESRGPLLYGCRRGGPGGREILVLKFRKMRHGCSGGALTVADDERFTRIGSFLAATRLDELPQLWNVLRGDMSLVGPRPEDPTFVALRQADFERILRVRPGITGLSQLAFARERDILDAADPIGHYAARILPQKIGLDTVYMSQRTLAMDLRIVLWTVVAVVLRRDVSVERGTGRLGLRRRAPDRGPR
jgi:lipopolysaccharide/colanic/teichoic acid biosynthesis glycosyltransferase